MPDHPLTSRLNLRAKVHDIPASQGAGDAALSTIEIATEIA